MDDKLTISKHPNRTPKCHSLLDNLGQTVQGIPNCKAFGFIIGVPYTMLSSSTDHLHAIYMQNNEPTHSTPFLGATIKLHMHSFAWDKACLWWQTHFSRGNLSAVRSVQVYWPIWLGLPLTLGAACEV